MEKIATCKKDIELMGNDFKKGDKLTLDPLVCLHNIISLMPEYFEVVEVGKDYQERLF
jgi:hypothetical protein